MVHLKRTLSILSLSILVLCAEFAFAYVPQRGNVMAYLGPYTYKTEYNGVLSDLQQDTGGISLIASGDVSDHGALEMAAIFMHKYYFRDEGDRSIAQRTQTMHITIAYRRYWAPSFATSVGVYTNYPMGNINTIRNDFADSEGVNTSASSPSETGIDIALQGELWQSGLWALMAEGRYSYALTKQPNEYSNQYGIFLGLRYFIQARVEKPKTLKDQDKEKPTQIKTQPEQKKEKAAPKGTSSSPQKKD
ncbi:hypothetical protein ACLVWU_11315 [Bdellovibrio sp. HCB290]|uniref:hypothetical protein n=1 Tax=Bdellovibrio sp. HCB290 TaxID=3394356 RepID=UPI0039B48688